MCEEKTTRECPQCYEDTLKLIESEPWEKHLDRWECEGCGYIMRYESGYEKKLETIISKLNATI